MCVYEVGVLETKYSWVRLDPEAGYVMLGLPGVRRDSSPSVRLLQCTHSLVPRRLETRLCIIATCNLAIIMSKFVHIMSQDNHKSGC